jgi:hypothetical protein
MKSSASKKPVGRAQESEPHKKQKKRYDPPRFAVLSPDEAKLWLSERGLPSETTTEQPLTAASLLEQDGTGEQSSIPGGAKVRRTKKGA